MRDLLRMVLLVVVLGLLVAVKAKGEAATEPAPEAVENLVKNGDFAQAAAGGDFAAGWGRKDGMTWETEEGKRFVRLVSQQAGQSQMLYALVPLKGSPRGVNVTIRYRTKQVEAGAQSWFDARAMLQFWGADNKQVAGGGGGAMVFSRKPAAEQWTDVSRSFVVPKGATQVQFMAGLFQAKSGTVDIAEIRMVPMKEADAERLAVTEEENRVRAAKAAEEREQKVEEELAARLKATGNLVENGNFETDGKKSGWPDGWGRSAPEKGLTAGEENGDHYLRLSVVEPGKLVMLYRVLPLPRGVKGLEVSVKYRVEGLERGAQMPGDARLVMHLLDGHRYGALEGGKQVKGDAGSLGFSGKAKEWTEAKTRFLLPTDATKLQMMPGLWFAKAGTLDIAEIKVVPMSDADAVALAAKIEAGAKEKAERAAIIEKELALPGKAVELKVAGNQVVDPEGKPVWLQGLSVDSLEWGMGENILWSIHVAMDEWKANVIRLPVRETFWFGKGKGQKEGSEEVYRKLVDDAVKLVAAKGGHLVLDLHGFGAPTEAHVAFWKDAAARYKNNPAVLFELFNEPHGISWELWRNGGELKSNTHKDVNPDENAEKVKGETTTGVQALVEAVRGAGAKNIVVAGALDWAYDLSGIVKGFALDDKGGNGVMYVSHIYPQKTGWQEKVLVAAEKVPVIVTEVGCPRTWKDLPFIPPAQQYPLEGWSEDMLGCIQKYKLHWTGFSFHPTCGPQVIKDWTYAPTEFWGVYVKEALAGKTFEMKKMR